MALYACCDKEAPHIVRAFINNDVKDEYGPVLPEHFLCIPVDEADVDAEKILVGMVWGDNGIEPYTPPPPAVVTSAQAKLALYNAGILDKVATAAQVYPPMRIYFDNASEWYREHPYVEGMAAQLDLSKDQVDNLFREANKL